MNFGGTPSTPFGGSGGFRAPDIKIPSFNIPDFKSPCINNPCINNPTPDIGQIYQNIRTTPPPPTYYTGYGGAKCSIPDILAGTYQSNNLNEPPKSGGAIGSMFGGNITGGGWKFDCSIDNIIGVYTPPNLPPNLPSNPSPTLPPNLPPNTE